MFKLLVSAVFAVSSVLAVEMPIFSSNDDYDEINLNIRLLQASNVTKSNKTEEGFVLAATATITTSAPDGTTATTLNADAAFKGAFSGAVANVTGVPKTAVAVTAVTDASRRLEVARKLAVTLTLDIAYTIKFASKAAAETVATTLAAGDATVFATSLATALTSELQAISTDYAVTSVTSKGATVAAAGATTAAPVAETTAAPAKTTPTADASDDDGGDDESSDASMIKMNAALLAGVAMVASLF